MSLAIPAEYRRGAERAAGVADTFNATTTHPYRLGDSILKKLNLRPGKPRKNGNPLNSPDRAWIAGFAIALSELHRRTGSSDIVCVIAREAGLKLRDMKRAGVDPFDWRELARAGLK